MNRVSIFRQWLAITPFAYGLASLYLLYLGITQKPLPVESDGAACTIGALYCGIACVLALAIGRFPIFSFPGAFLGVSGLYMVGLLITYPIHGDDVFATWYVVDMEGILRGIPLVMLAFSAFLIGSALTARRICPSPSTPAPAGLRFDRLYVRLTGGAMCALAFAIIAGYTLAGGGLNYALSGGYAYLAEKQYQEGGEALFWGALAWFLPWGVIILAAGAERLRDLRWFIFAAVPANVILVLTGDRGGLLVLDLVLIMRFTLLGFRIKWWQGIGLAALIIVAVPTLMVMRQTASKNWTLDAFKEAITLKSDQTLAFSTDPISATLVEGGTSYKVLMATTLLVPSVHDYHYGLDYVASLIAGVPFFSRLFPDAVPHNAEWVKEHVDHAQSKTGLGFLQVAEAYLQFGSFGVAVFYCMAGVGLSRLWRLCQEKALAYHHLAYCLIVVNTALLWVRNEFHIAVKPAVWCFLLLVVLPWLIKRLVIRPSPRSLQAPEAQPEAGAADAFSCSP